MKGAAKTPKFSTCQCPGQATDRLGARLPEERKDGNGKVVAVMCKRCTLPITLVCRHCQGQFEDIDEHCKRADSCGLDVAYRAARAVTGGGRVSKKAPKAQAALFSDDVLRGPRREGMGGR